MDHTLFFNKLEKITPEADLHEHFSPVAYAVLNEEKLSRLKDFMEQYQSRLHSNSISKAESLDLMKKTNPKFILRNYLLYQCIEEINAGKTAMLMKLTQALENPYQELFTEFSVKRPSSYDNTAGCSTLSCSS